MWGGITREGIAPPPQGAINRPLRITFWHKIGDGHREETRLRVGVTPLNGGAFLRDLIVDARGAFFQRG